MATLGETVKGLWSLIVGLKITGVEFFKPKITIHFPRKEVDNLGTYRGHVDLVPRDDDPLTAKCIMCGQCVDACPSGCLSFTMHVEGDPVITAARPPLKLGLDVTLIPSQPKDKAPEEMPRVLDGFLLNYNLCSLCGLCVQTCPVSSLKFSREAYLAGQSRAEFEFNLLTRLRGRGAKSGASTARAA